MTSRTYTKKMWTAESVLADHRAVANSLLRILGAYVGPHAIEPKLNEAVMVTVNSVNSCPYCKGLHGELARMAGVEDSMRLMGRARGHLCEDLRRTRRTRPSTRGGLRDARSQRGSRAGSIDPRAVLVPRLGEHRRKHRQCLPFTPEGSPEDRLLRPLRVDLFRLLRASVPADRRRERVAAFFPESAGVVLGPLWGRADLHRGDLDPSCRHPLYDLPRPPRRARRRLIL